MSTRTLAGMAVETDGAGEPVIMVHGLGGTSNTFTPLMGVFADGCAAARPDLVGSGRSPLDGELTVGRFADDILALAVALGHESVHLVGHSMGTIVCQHIAARHPECVRSLALLGALMAPPEPARGALRQRAAEARAHGMADIADAVSQASTSPSTRRSLPVAVAAVRESLMRQCPNGYAATCEALADAVPADLSAIACPTLVVNGEEDAVVPAAAARALGDRIGAARLVMLPRCGHWPSFERADDVARELRHFYRGIG
jgi:pimeloyl-ACP methyl ester carboxylesterase